MFDLLWQILSWLLLATAEVWAGMLAIFLGLLGTFKYLASMIDWVAILAPLLLGAVLLAIFGLALLVIRSRARANAHDHPAHARC